MYSIFRTISYLIRFTVCYFTIDRIPIFKNESIGWMITQYISIYCILWLISYKIVGNIYKRGDNPVMGTMLYAIIYVVLILPIWGILILVNKF